jgi:transposase
LDENIELRRARVLELVAQGLSQNEIQQKLGVSAATVSLDMQYLRETGKSKMKTHIEERMPMQYEECQASLKFMLRKAYEIVEDMSKKTGGYESCR